MRKGKKFIVLLLMLICLFGCAIGNTPTKKVEDLLKKYQSNTDSIKTELNDYIKTLNIPDNYVDDYKKVYLKQYSDLKYEIKNESINGDNATVETEIEVYDYYKTENDVTSYIATNPTEFAINGVYSVNEGLKYKIDALNNTKDRVKYTINFTLTKVNDNWTIDNLTDEILEKIHGTYAH
jgi:hypothetical protein